MIILCAECPLIDGVREVKHCSGLIFEEYPTCTEIYHFNRNHILIFPHDESEKFRLNLKNLVKNLKKNDLVEAIADLSEIDNSLMING